MYYSFLLRPRTFFSCGQVIQIGHLNKNMSSSFDGDGDPGVAIVEVLLDTGGIQPQVTQLHQRSQIDPKYSQRRHSKVENLNFLTEALPLNAMFSLSDILTNINNPVLS